MVSACAGLSPDEAYYWVWSKALASGYLDHPPMVALFVRAGTAIAGDTALGIRLCAPIAAYLGSCLAGVAARDLTGDPGAFWRAALMLNATLLLAAGAVTMTPDTPLLLFWTAAIAALGRFHATGRGAWLLAAGAAAGLALDSKYTAVLLLPAILFWLGTERGSRGVLATIWPWAGAGLALALFAPVIGWNAAHGWASFAKQGGRVGDFAPARAVGFLAELVGGQIGLATPILACLFAVGCGRAWRAGPGERLLVWLTLVPALVFIEHALGDRVQANWPAILYPSAAIAASAYAWRWWRPACALGFALQALLYLDAATLALPVPSRADPLLARLGGWQAFAGQVFARAHESGAAFVTADEYGVASMLAFYRPAGAPPVLGGEARWGFFALARASVSGRGLLVRPARHEEPPDASLWRGTTAAGEMDRVAAGRLAERYRVYEVVPAGDAPELP